jgi:hypothetical protein
VAAEPRTPETVARELELERERLATAVSGLRTDLQAAASPKAIVRKTWPVLATVGALTVGTAAFRIARRRRRQTVVGEVVRAQFGRFTVLERL